MANISKSELEVKSVVFSFMSITDYQAAIRCTRLQFVHELKDIEDLKQDLEEKLKITETMLYEAQTTPKQQDK